MWTRRRFIQAALASGLGALVPAAAGCSRSPSASAIREALAEDMRRDPRVGLSIQDPDNAYRYLEIRGKVVDITETGAVAHIDALAKHYMGLDTYPFHQPGVVRVIYRIEPLQVSTMG